jgi:hypothetical protein
LVVSQLDYGDDIVETSGDTWNKNIHAGSIWLLTAVVVSGRNYSTHEILAAAGLFIVRDEARSMTFKSIKRQATGLRVELGVIQERHFARPLELMIATHETTSEPTRHVDPHDPLSVSSAVRVTVR